MMSIVNSTLSFILGADYEILRLCPTDFAKQRKRIIVACFVSLVVWYAANALYDDVLSVILACVVMLLYITYLCKHGSSSFLKFILALAVASFIFYGVSYPLYGGVDRLTYVIDGGSIVTAYITGIIALVIGFMPVNFSNSDNGYLNLLKMKIQGKAAAGKLEVEEKINADKQIIHDKELLRVKLERDLAQYSTEQILKAQKCVIDKLVSKWIKDIETKVDSNPNEFIINRAAQQISINKTAQDELDKYITNLLVEKRKEFADIIIEKWSEEKKKQAKVNPKAFVS